MLEHTEQISGEQIRRRKDLYKIKSCGSSQGERRIASLCAQKRKRDEAFNASRRILETDEFDEDEAISPRKGRSIKSRYADQLMLSEWLEEVPSDLEANWLFVPCPTGKRCLLIAEKNFSHAYSARGKHLFKCRPLLKEGRVGRTVLDCIFSRVTNTFYILDVLVWADHPLLDCDAEFRSYWLKSKFEENPDLLEVKGADDCRFVLLPNVPASSTEIEALLSAEQTFSETMDGVLFFHKEAHYTPGISPLVVWLLPFMVPEVLGISVNDLLMAQRPAAYPGHVEFIAKYKKQSGREHRLDLSERKAATRAAQDVLGSSMDTTHSDGGEDKIELG